MSKKPQPDFSRADLYQLDLVTKILKILGKMGFESLLNRNINTVIKAANLICDDLSVPYQPAEKGMTYSEWSQCDDVGISSKYLSTILRGIASPSPTDQTHPMDASDFNRCVKMVMALDLYGEIERLKSRTGGLAPEWGAVINNWDNWVLKLAESPDKLSEEMDRAYLLAVSAAQV